MKRCLMILVVISAAACQTTTTTERAQTLTEDPCTAQLPYAPLWDGKYVTPPGPNELQIVVTSPFAQGELLATRVDYVQGKIVSALRVPVQQAGPFYFIAGKYGRLVVPTAPPPPPTVLPPWLIYAAARYADVPTEALADTQVCY